MLPLNLTVPLSIMVILTGCIHAKSPENRNATQSEFTTGEADTLVATFPVDYMKSLEAMDASRKLGIRNYEDILQLFEKLDYTPEAWQAGIRKVPRVYLTLIGPNWGTTASREVTVLNKKRIFFRGLAPMILRANELILADRDRLEKVRSAFKNDPPLTETDQIWILKLASLYKAGNEGQVTQALLDELWEKVDKIPPSLALAQGAEESGWGTSRFAAEGNAVYGQWTWGKNAIKPEAQREGLGNYGIAAFESLQESVCAYMLNLNTHPAYAGLRARRAELRRSGEPVTGLALAETLTKYSERGEEYVKTLKSMMEYNLLEPTDDAYLSDDPPIYLVPAAE